MNNAKSKEMVFQFIICHNGAWLENKFRSLPAMKTGCITIIVKQKTIAETQRAGGCDVKTEAPPNEGRAVHLVNV